MNKDIKDLDIQVYGEKESNAAPVQLPVNFINIGEVENDDIKVYIRQDIYKSIESFASSDTTKELGSILIGDYVEELGKNHVVISGYVEAKYTDASASTLTFTHQTWDYIHEEHEKLFPDKKIIGWQHTHPDYGIFLSNYDMFIQENFFNLPWQIAYVVDPINKTRGFFQWKNGKVQKLNGFYIYDEAQKKIDIPQKKNENSLGRSYKKTGAAASFRSLDIAALLVILLASAGLIYSLLSLTAMKQNVQAVQNQLSTEEKANQELNGKYNDLSDKNNSLNSQLSEVKQSMGQQPSKGQPEESTTDKGSNNIVFTKYTVKAGDSISSICKALNVDYSSNVKVIKGINGLEDLNDIKVGQVLLIPVK